MNLSNNTEISTDGKAFLELMNQKQLQIFAKREAFKINLAALKNGDPPVDIATDNEKYFDENNRFIPQRLGAEVLSILKIKKGQAKALFYWGDDEIYKPAEQIVKQLINQLFSLYLGGWPIGCPILLSKHFTKSIKKYGLSLNFHGLRHSYATALLEAGEHPKVVQELLGDSTISVVLDTYSHVLPGLKERAASKLDYLFATKKPSSAKEG